MSERINITPVLRDFATIYKLCDGQNEWYARVYTGRDGNGRILDSHVAEDIATKIVRAVNAHDDLLAAAEAALKMLELADQDRYDDGKMTNQLKAAITKART